MSKVGDVFEKSVELPDSSDKIYYKVGALHLLCYYFDRCSDRITFVHQIPTPTSAAFRCCPWEAIDAPAPALQRTRHVCENCQQESSRRPTTATGPNPTLCDGAAANAPLLGATRTTPRNTTATNTATNDFPSRAPPSIDKCSLRAGQAWSKPKVLHTVLMHHHHHDHRYPDGRTPRALLSMVTQTFSTCCSGVLPRCAAAAVAGNHNSHLIGKPVVSSTMNLTPNTLQQRGPGPGPGPG